MPGVYAHYRFGAAMLEQMPGDISRSVRRYRQLYDMGLHGPDLFFYYSPLRHTAVGALGSKFHHQSGKDFFTRVCRSLRLSAGEAGSAYLYGLLCHYCLDALCHPLVKEESEKGTAGHVEIESEFDRYLLEKDGKTPARSQDLSPHMRLTAGECAEVARFYPPATPAQIRRCAGNMALVTKVLAMPEGIARTALDKAVDVVAAQYKSLLIPAQPNPRCCQLDAPLEALSDQAAAEFPALLASLNAHLTYNAPLEAFFAKTFDPGQN